MDFYNASLQDDVLIVRADGDLNGPTAEVLIGELENLVSGGIRKIVVDCERLEHVTSYGLGMLVRLHGKLAPRGGIVKVCSVKGVIAKALHITRLDRLFEMYPTIDEALGSFQSPRDP